MFSFKLPIAIVVSLLVSVSSIIPAGSIHLSDDSVETNDSVERDSGTSKDNTVRLSIDDPVVAEKVAASVSGSKVVLQNSVFAVIETPEEKIDHLRVVAQIKGVDVIQEDSIGYRMNVVPTDPLYIFAPGLPQMNLPAAWAISQGSSNTTIAIIDSGVATIPDLQNRVLPGYSFISGQPARVSVLDGQDDGHGTMSAAVAAAGINNNIASVGSCPKCLILPIRTFAQNSNTTSLFDVAAAVVWATDNGADVISMSLGGKGNLAALADAVKYANSKGVLLVASAGNSGETLDATTPMYPASYPEVLSVAAIDDNADLYSWSSRGQTVDFAAHGCNPAQSDELLLILFCGTSSAAPLLAGALALRIDQAGSIKPDVLRSEAVSVRSPVANIAGGRIDAGALLNLTPTYPQAPFMDVARPSYYAKAVDWAFAEGITNGVSQDLFGIERSTTRAEIVTFLWRYAGRPAPVGVNPFTDVPANSWYAQSTAWAAEQGITTGTSPTLFSPQRSATRAESVTFLWRSAGKPIGPN